MSYSGALYILICILTVLRLVHCWDKADPLDIEDFVYATVAAGRLRGFSTRTSADGPQAYVFKRIPFAQPPVGRLRFAPLRPPAKGREELDATQYAPACMSNTTYTTSHQSPQSEDCIYANVFTSPACMVGLKRGRCPVLFYIHGGDFLFDSAVMFNDRQIVDKYAADDVVFVVAGYRIGIFGFADLGSDAAIPRNNGFYDIAFALRWTVDVIHTFGGDPHRITVMGNSGGANAVAYLMTARSVVTGKEARPLFAQAILSSMAPAFGHDLNIDVTRQIFEQFQCLRPNASATTRELRAAVDCMRMVDAVTLIDAQAAAEAQGSSFRGVTATADLSAEDFVGLFDNLRPTRMLITTTALEFTSSDGEKDGSAFYEECEYYTSFFGYHTQHMREACSTLYGDPANSKIRQIAAEAIHAEADVLAAANRRRGGVSYRGSFELTNHTRHADDLLFFIGLHWERNKTLTPAERLMDIYYPAMIKRFLRGDPPDKDWKPVSSDGRGYFVLDFQVSHHVVQVRPYAVPNAYVDPKGIEFWLKDAAAIEKYWRPLEADENVTETDQGCSELDNYWALCNWWPIRMWCGVRSAGQQCFQHQTNWLLAYIADDDDVALESSRGVAFYLVSGVSIAVVVGVVISIVVILIRRRYAALAKREPTERTPLTKSLGG